MRLRREKVARWRPVPDLKGKFGNENKTTSSTVSFPGATGAAVRGAVALIVAAAALSGISATGDDRFPFQVSYGGADNASSVAHLLDAPAGKHGFVRVEGNEFVTDAGPIRFNGTNLTGPANFPEHATAQLDKLDCMTAAFKKRGIYVNMNLHVGRTLDIQRQLDYVDAHRYFHHPPSRSAAAAAPA